jgi:hypothetical protein
MKSPGVIYRQYRQARKLAFLRLITASRNKTHENCAYAGVISYLDVDGKSKQVKICKFRPDSLDVCTNPRDCNAFSRKWQDEQIAERFSSIMSNQAEMKRHFPELWTYEWVLDKSLNEARKSAGFLGSMIVSMIALLESALRSLGGKKKIME